VIDLTGKIRKKTVEKRIDHDPSHIYQMPVTHPSFEDSCFGLISDKKSDDDARQL